MSAQVGCAACIDHLVDFDFGLLPENDAAVVSEHLSACPDCRIFKDQLEITREILGRMPAPGLPDILQQAQSELVDASIEHSLKGLYRAAHALDVEDADELVQQTLVEAISKGATLNTVDLIDELIRKAHRTHDEPTESLNEASENGPFTFDPDGETAELYYPEFYEEGPDVGRFIESPNVWGYAPPLTPQDDVETIELFDIVDSAVYELPELEMRLITLVDLHSVALEDAAKALRTSPARAARALNHARIHVRGAIDNYLTAGAPSTSALTSGRPLGSEATDQSP